MMVDVPPMAMTAPVMTGASPVPVPVAVPVPVPVVGDALGVTRVSGCGRRAGQTSAGDGENARKDKTY
jgi:hypothetical protein